MKHLVDTMCRWEECTDIVSDTVDKAIGSMYVKKYLEILARRFSTSSNRVHVGLI